MRVASQPMRPRTLQPKPKASAVRLTTGRSSGSTPTGIGWGRAPVKNQASLPERGAGHALPFFCKKGLGEVQQLQAKPRRGSSRMALSCRPIESSLSRLLMLELIYLTAPFFLLAALYVYLLNPAKLTPLRSAISRFQVVMSEWWKSDKDERPHAPASTCINSTLEPK